MRQLREQLLVCSANMMSAKRPGIQTRNHIAATNPTTLSIAYPFTLAVPKDSSTQSREGVKGLE